MKRALVFWKSINKKNFSTLAGAISFFTVVNGGSIVFLTLIFLNFFNIEIVVNSTDGVNQIERLLIYIYETSKQISASYSIFFVFTSLWSSSTLFFHLIKTGELLYQTDRKRFSFATRIGSIMLVLVFLALIVCSIFVFFVLNYISSMIKIKLIYKILQTVVMVLIPFTIIIYFNIFVPPIRVPFKKTIKGSLATLIFWIIATFCFLIYINVFVNFKIIYGALNFFIVFMIWIYLLAQGLIIGLIINSENWLKLKV